MLSRKAEVDFLLERGSTLTAIEAKSGQTIPADFFKGLSFWRGLPRQEKAPAALVYGREEGMRREGVAVWSWGAWL